MGEMWKKLPDDDKKPFFLMARKAAAKHKKALELNPNLAYVPSKKKVKKTDKKEEEEQQKAEAAAAKQRQTSSSPYPTPSASPITSTPRQGGCSFFPFHSCRPPAGRGGRQAAPGHLPAAHHHRARRQRALPAPGDRGRALRLALRLQGGAGAERIPVRVTLRTAQPAVPLW